MAKGHAVQLGIMQLAVLLTGLLLIPFANVHAQAASPLLLITEVQPQSATAKTEEFIEIYNPTDQAVSLNSFQVVYFSAANSSGSPLVLTPSLLGTSLKSHGYLLLKQSGYQLEADASFANSGLSDGGGHVQILLNNQVIDTVGWGTAAHPEGQAAQAVAKEETISRAVNADGFFQDTDNNLMDFQGATPSPTGGGIVEDVPDVCSNIEGIQVVPPMGYEVIGDGTCQLIKVCQLEVSEISAQPNLNGQEYIEFRNNSPSTMTAQLCQLSINGGSQRILPEQEMLPGSYLVMAFTSGVIRNTAGSVVLVQSDGLQTVYEYPTAYSGQTANFETGSYRGVVSDQPTPGAENQTMLFEEVEAGKGGGETLAECPEGKYRNPATNRCKNIETATATLTPCDEDQERSPATNRCRKITTAAATLTPCAPDQERNLATNRCRKITAASTELKPCASGQERNPETNRCRKILAAASTPAQLADQQASGGIGSRFKLNAILILTVLTALLGYGAYEYRADLQNYIRKIRDSKIRGRPPG